MTSILQKVLLSLSLSNINEGLILAVWYLQEFWIGFRNRLFRTNRIRKHWKELLFSVSIGGVVVLMCQTFNNPLIPSLNLINLISWSFLSLILFVLSRQLSSLYYSKYAKLYNDMSSTVWQVDSSAEYYSKAGKYEKAASILYNQLIRSRDSIDRYYNQRFNDYLKAVGNLSPRNRLLRLSSDALLLTDEQLLLFMDLFGEFLLLQKGVTDSIGFNELVDRFTKIGSSLKAQEQSVLTLKFNIVDAILKSTEENWDDVIKILDLIKGYKWDKLHRIVQCFNFLAQKAYRNEDSKSFIQLYAFRVNLHLFSTQLYESSAPLVYNRWGEDGIFKYMEYVGNLPNDERNRYAPRFKILTDVLEIAESKRLHSFILENLELLLGYVSDGIWTPSFVLQTIMTSFSSKIDFTQELLQKAISLLEVYPEIRPTIAHEAKFQGIILNSKNEFHESVQFFKVAVQIGMTLPDKTIAITSTTYLVHHYLNNYQKTGNRTHIEQFLEMLKSDEEQYAIVLSNVIGYTHQLGLLEDREDFIERFEHLKEIPPMANGNVMLVKYRIALSEGLHGQAIGFLEKAAYSYGLCGKFRSAGRGWLHAGSLSWQAGELGNIKEYYEKALLCFQKAGASWWEATVLAGLNRWSDISQALNQQLVDVKHRIDDIDFAIENTRGRFVPKNIPKEVSKQKENLLFEQTVIEAVLKACKGVNEWDHQNYQSALPILSDSRSVLNDRHINESHPSAAFVFALRVLLGYYISMARIYISRSKMDYEEAHAEANELVAYLENQQTSLAPIHKPLLKIILEIAYAEQRITKSLDSSASDEERINAKINVISDYKRIRSSFEELGLTEEVERINESLTILVSMDEIPTSFDSSLKVPLSSPSESLLSYEESVDATSETEYISNVLSILLKAGRNMERTAKDFNNMLEPQLSTILVNILKSHSMNASRETYSVSGYTDIYIQISGSCTLIVECKWWHGKKQCKSAIEQIFRYLTVRDGEAIIITFCKDKGYSSIIQSAEEAIRTHPTYIDDSLTHEQPDKSYTTAHHRHPSNSNTQTKIHHMFFNLFFTPKKSKKKIVK